MSESVNESWSLHAMGACYVFTRCPWCEIEEMHDGDER